LDDQGIRVRFLVGEREFFSSPYHPGWLWGPPRLLYNGYWRLSPEIKWQGCEADHPPQSSAEVKNGGAIPPHPIHLHGMVLLAI
jgi:hypothetical protein